MTDQEELDEICKYFTEVPGFVYFLKKATDLAGDRTLETVERMTAIANERWMAENGQTVR